MKTGNKGIELIISFEGFSAKPYLCPAGVWTIGYGMTVYPDGKRVKSTDAPITKERAKELLVFLLARYEGIVNRKLKTPVNQNQYDALVSHTFNTGGSDTLFKLVNEKVSKEQIRKWFETRYITGGGKPLAGLVRRRKAEADLYFS